MADQVKATIQSEIKAFLSQSRQYLYSFVLNGKSGDCEVPAGVHIRFKNCDFSSFKAVEGGNNFDFENCQFNEPKNYYKFEAGSAIFNNCEIEASLSFENFNIEILDSIITQNIALNSCYLKSKKNQWQADTENKNEEAITASNASKIESFFDTFEGWIGTDISIADNSYAKFCNVILIDLEAGATFAKSAGNSLIQFYDMDEVKIDKELVEMFRVDDFGRIEVLSSKGISTQGNLVKATNSGKVIFKKIDKLENLDSDSTETLYFLDVDKSTVEFYDVDSISSETNGLFKVANSSIIKANNVPSFVSNPDGPMFLITDSEFDIINKDIKNTKINSKDKVTIQATNSTLNFKNIDSLDSGQDSSFILKNTDIILTNINSITGSGGFGISADTCLLVLNNVKTVTGQSNEGLFLNNSKLVIDIMSDIFSSGNNLAAIKSTNSKVIIKNTKNIESRNGGPGIDSTGSYFIFDNVDNIKGAKTGIVLHNSNNIYGLNVKLIKGFAGLGIDGSDGKQSNLNFANVGQIEGSVGYGIHLSNSDLTVKNNSLSSSTIKGSTTGIFGSNDSEGSYTIDLVGPLIVDGANSLELTNFILTEKGITFKKGVTTKSCLWNSNYSNLKDKNVNTGSILNFNRTAITGSTEANGLTVFNAIKSKFAGSLLGNQGIFNFKGTEAAVGFSDLVNSSYLGLLTSLKSKVPSSDSFIGNFGGNSSSVSIAGKGSALLAGQTSATVITQQDGTLDGVSIFATSGGDLVIQADNLIKERAAIFDSIMRNTYTSLTQNNVLLSSQSTIVNLQAQQQIIESVGGSSITIVPAQITVSSAKVII